MTLKLFLSIQISVKFIYCIEIAKLKWQSYQKMKRLRFTYCMEMAICILKIFNLLVAQPFKFCHFHTIHKPDRYLGRQTSYHRTIHATQYA